MAEMKPGAGARVLQQRRYRKGTRPGFSGTGPQGAGDEKKWEFGPSPALTEQDKKMVMSEVLRLATELMYETHLYNFNGRSFKQQEGGPIGLRSMCALARVVMGRWDIKWNKRMAAHNFKVEDDGLFVDDARVFMYPVRPGWRWVEGGLWFKKERKEQGQFLSPTEITKRLAYESMQGLTECLSFTVETHDEFSGVQTQNEEHEHNRVRLP